ncbi:aldo/keto reductase [Brevibacterium album]|uniref:aldo/keto reductase n=1 Tax=Brevibacterium album TaxID=417948 RepID=UPI00048BB20A|nr:aldo/keto reductase [Brevibacterium album]
MRQYQMGRTGLHVSELSLGTFEWGRRVDEATAQELLDAYAAAGGTLVELPSFDAPAVDLLGRLRLPSALALAARVGVGAPDGQPRRYRTGRVDLLADVRALMSRLGRDRIEVLVLDAFDPGVPLEETASALAVLAQRGDVGYVMVSHHTAWQLALLTAFPGVPIAGAVAEYSLLLRDAEADLRPALDHMGLGLIAGAGLGRGVLTGQYLARLPRGSRAGGDLADYVGELLDDDSTGIVQGAVKAAAALGVSAVDIALAWNREAACASTLVSPRTREQLDQLLASELTLAPEIRDVLAQISDPLS